MKLNSLKPIATMAFLPIAFTACHKGMDSTQPTTTHTISIENVLESRPLVESGTFKHDGAAPVVMPGESVSFQFSAGKGQSVTFATMYGWSNDLFFAPANPGITLFDTNGNPVEGDVSSSIKLWDNGTRINQIPGSAVQHPGVAVSSSQNVMEVNGTDAQGNTYAAASSLMKVTLKYNGDSKFTLTINNTSGNTTNPTPFSPGVWAVSYNVGGSLLSPNPIYKSGNPTANGLTNLAEMGDNSLIGQYIASQTGIFTPLSPVLVVVYKGIDNPIYTAGQIDAGHGLKNLAQTGDASGIAAYLKTVSGVKNVYVLPAATSTVLLPMVNGQSGSMVSQQLDIEKGDKIAIATMWGLSNDWFFASKTVIDGNTPGDYSTSIGLFDDGTAVSQLPGAGYAQAALGGSPIVESQNITEVPSNNPFVSLPTIDKFIKVTLQ
ncbi:MAG: hypothetical protein DI598_17710 [Pseudopedobacter saltans]|uniref:Secreted protein n=1 Tax=Pseudopedobacter saltans TaxID=151895 RepID=A0A2W5GF00_9SPHI|nr:MAG: hypothetical protein DI598_17710 [Pseudopedobacter saltans]